MDEISNLKHNHPTTNELVKNCPYCIKYGNIFEHGILKFNDINLDELNIIYALKNIDIINKNDDN